MPAAALDKARLAPLHAAHVAELEARYAVELARAGVGAVVLHSGSPRLRSQFDDNYWPLRVTPHFQHWLPLEHPDCALVVEPGKRPKLVWPHVPNYWENLPDPEWSGWRAAFEIVDVSTIAAVKEHLPAGAAYVGDGHQAHAWGIDATLVNPPELVTALDRTRTTKTDYEVVCIAEANRRAALGHERVARAFLDGDTQLSEFDLHLAYLAATRQDDAETPYKNIFATDENAATLHHVCYLRTPRKPRGGSLLVDAGATFLGYASDITRTYVRPGGAAEDAFAHLLDGMKRLQRELVAHVAVGLPYELLHEEAHRLVGHALREAGVVRLSDEEASERGVTRAFFPHGLGHSLGLQTHDVGCAVIKPKPRNPHLRNTSVIAERQVFTIEPGVYFIPGLMAELRQSPEASTVDWHLVDELAKLGGIRIEDDVLVAGAQQPRNLTREVLPV